MAFDMFLKLGAIDGGSTDDKHKGEIEISSFSWGLTNAGPSPVPGGGGASGHAAPGDLHLTKDVDVASAPIFLACARGDAIPQGLLTVRKAGGRPLEYLHLQLGAIRVTSYQVGSAHGQENATEQFSLAFGRVQMQFTPQNPDGSAGTTISAAFDFIKNAGS